MSSNIAWIIEVFPAAQQEYKLKFLYINIQLHKWICGLHCMLNTCYLAKQQFRTRGSGGGLKVTKQLKVPYIHVGPNIKWV